MLWVLKRTVSMRRFFEHPKHMFGLLGKKIIAFLRSKILLNWTYAINLLTLCMLGNFSCWCCRLLTFFKTEKKFMNTIRVPNGLDSDQDRSSVGPDLAPNCLQTTSPVDKQFKETFLMAITNKMQIFSNLDPRIFLCLIWGRKTPPSQFKNEQNLPNMVYLSFPISQF